MANENENLEIKKKPQQVSEKDINKVAGGDWKTCENEHHSYCGTCID